MDLTNVFLKIGSLQTCHRCEATDLLGGLAPKEVSIVLVEPQSRDAIRHEGSA